MDPRRGRAVGSKAPAIDLKDARGVPVSARELAGLPRVVAFLPREHAAHVRTDDTLRSHLRGAGAALLLVTADEVLFLQADDAPRTLHADVDDGAASRAADRLALAYGVDSRAEAAGFDEAFFVIDEAGIVRFASIGSAGAGGAMSHALRTARAELQAARAPAPHAASSSSGVGRREVLTLALSASFAAALLEACKPRGPSPGVTFDAGETTTTQAAVDRVVPEVDVTLNVNGVPRPLKIEPRVTLLDALRERLSLTGTKKGCDHGQCGACTVHVDGRSVNACLTLAIACEGSQVTTIEGLATGEKLHPMQQAFLDHDAYQCGYCTPGQIMSAVWLTKTNRAKTTADVREMMSGNICRCGAYANIVSAVQSVGGIGGAGGTGGKRA